MCTLIFSSCNKDERVLSSAVPKPNETPEQYLERRMNDFKASGKTVTVEHATLEEINNLMRAEGLPEISRKEVQQSVQKRTVWPCYVWINHGDWNNSGTFTAFDLVQARKYICNYPGSGGCNGSVNVWQGTHPPAAGDFAFLSWLANGTDDLLLNLDDVNFGTSFILGLIPCN